MPKESRASISCTTKRTGGKGSPVTAARRRSGGSWWRGAAVIFARIARRGGEGRRFGARKKLWRGDRLRVQQRLSHTDDECAAGKDEARREPRSAELDRFVRGRECAFWCCSRQKGSKKKLSSGGIDEEEAQSGRCGCVGVELGGGAGVVGARGGGGKSVCRGRRADYQRNPRPQRVD